MDSWYNPDSYYTQGPEVYEDDDERAEREYYEEREWDWEQERHMIEDSK